MFSLARRGRTFRHLFIAASFALPDRISAGWIRGTLIDCAIGWNYFATAAWTNATARSSFANIDPQKILFSHSLKSNGR